MDVQVPRSAWMRESGLENEEGSLNIVALNLLTLERYHFFVSNRERKASPLLRRRRLNSQARFSVQVVWPSRESVLSATSWLQLAR